MNENGSTKEDALRDVIQSEIKYMTIHELQVLYSVLYALIQKR